MEAIVSTVGLQPMTHELLIVEDNEVKRRAAGNCHGAVVDLRLSNSNVVKYTLHIIK